MPSSETKDSANSRKINNQNNNNNKLNSNSYNTDDDFQGPCRPMARTPKKKVEKKLHVEIKYEVGMFKKKEHILEY